MLVRMAKHNVTDEQKELAKYDNIEDVPDELKAKIRSYEEGRPDVVFRELG